jgi:DNA-binding NtrC family response regulator
LFPDCPVGTARTPGIVVLAPESLFVGSSAFSCGVRCAIEVIGPDDCNVVLQGPTGSGKRIVLQALYVAYGRGDLVRVPAVQLDGETLRSELVGYRGKSFTGADEKDRAGLLVQEHGGILGVEEADEIPARGQAWLVDIAEREELWPLGGGRPIRPDMRVVMCVHESPEALVARGWWRRDLLYRVAEETIVLLGLIEHMEDVPELTDHLVGRISRARGDCAIALARGVVGRLMAHAWPGNVRELDSVLKGACRRAWREAGKGQRIVVEARHLVIVPPLGLIGGRGRRVVLAVDQVHEALRKADGRVTIAAGILGVTPVTLRRRMKDFAIDLRDYRDGAKSP